MRGRGSYVTPVCHSALWNMVFHLVRWLVKSRMIRVIVTTSCLCILSLRNLFAAESELILIHVVSSFLTLCAVTGIYAFCHVWTCGHFGTSAKIPRDTSALSDLRCIRDVPHSDSRRTASVTSRASSCSSCSSWYKFSRLWHSDGDASLQHRC